MVYNWAFWFVLHEFFKISNFNCEQFRNGENSFNPIVLVTMTFLLLIENPMNLLTLNLLQIEVLWLQGKVRGPYLHLLCQSLIWWNMLIQFDMPALWEFLELKFKGKMLFRLAGRNIAKIGRYSWSTAGFIAEDLYFR